MRRKERQFGQGGLAALEAALLLPLLALLLAVLVEAGAALRTYGIIAEAGREAARLVVRDRDASAAPDLVRTLCPGLDQDNLAIEISMDQDNSIVIVEVRYDYPSLFRSVSSLGNGTPESFSLAAVTSMPLP